MAKKHCKAVAEALRHYAAQADQGEVTGAILILRCRGSDVPIGDYVGDLDPQKVEALFQLLNGEEE